MVLVGGGGDEHGRLLGHVINMLPMRSVQWWQANEWMCNGGRLL
jgi:hypothetical protein